MRVLSSLKSAKKRDKSCQVIKRGKKVFVRSKKSPRFNARQ